MILRAGRMILSGLVSLLHGSCKEQSSLHVIQRRLGDTEEDRLKAGSWEERGDRGCIQTDLHALHPIILLSSRDCLKHGLSPCWGFPHHRNEPREDCGAKIGILAEPRVELYNCSQVYCCKCSPAKQISCKTLVLGPKS